LTSLAWRHIVPPVIFQAPVNAIFQKQTKYPKQEVRRDMKRLLEIVAVAVLVTVGSTAVNAQANPLVGTWTLNLEKSKFDPGPGPKSLTRTIVAEGDGVKYGFQGVSADGKPIAYGFSVTFDGKDNPITGSMPTGADTIAGKRTGPNTFEATLKKGGKVIGTSKVEVSKDGKVTTVESHGTNPEGKPVHDKQVFDKQ
jgi:hypothetical protein